jgi:hypothetical protein
VSPRDPHASVRPAAEDDLDAIPALRRWLDAGATDCLVTPADARPRAAAALDPAGLPVEPDHPCLLLHVDDADDDAAALLEAILARARASGHDRLLARCDPLDRPALRRLEQRGFRPTGTPPYFEIGPGQVQYVTGYQDATGSWLNLAVALADSHDRPG